MLSPGTCGIYANHLKKLKKCLEQLKGKYHVRQVKEDRNILSLVSLPPSL